MLRLSRALAEAYGSDAWERFCAAGGHWGAGFDDLAGADVARLDVAIAGDKATCRMPDGEQRMSMLRMDGRWFMDLGSDVPPQAMTERSLNVVADMTAAVERGIGQVGKAGQSPESLNRLIVSEMMTAVRDGVATPNPPAPPME